MMHCITYACILQQLIEKSIHEFEEKGKKEYLDVQREEREAQVNTINCSIRSIEKNMKNYEKKIYIGIMYIYWIYGIKHIFSVHHYYL